MENYVKELLKGADLSVVTKKHVRMKYKEHVGRELQPEEKSKINDMVYAFVKELSTAAQQGQPAAVKPETSLTSKSESPGNKENEQSNQKSNKFIVTGNVVDDLFKSKGKEKENNHMEGKKNNEKRRNVENANSKGPPQTSPSYKNKAAAAKLKINDVMTAVLGSDQCVSSSEVSDVSSLTDTSLSEDEPEPGTKINEAVQKLKAAREKKIQMSHEKKGKSEKPEKGKPKRKARKSLCMREPTLNDLKKSTKTRDASDSISLFSEISSAGSEMDRERLMGNNVADIARSKHYDKAMKTRVKDLSEQDFDSGELKLKKTPQDYAKTKQWIGAKKSLETKKKLVKRKSKNTERETESDTDSDNETEDKPIPRVKRRRKVQEKKKNFRESENSDATESDSEDETLDKIAAREIGVKEKKSEQDDKTQHTCTKSKTGDKLIDKRNRLKKLITIHTDSESSTRDIHLAKMKKSKKSPVVDNNSDLSIGDTPLAKKKAKNSERDLELQAGDTPLVRKKKSDSDTGDISVTKRTSVKTKSSGFEKRRVDKKLIVKNAKNSKEKDPTIGKEKSEKSKYVHSNIEKKHVSRNNIQENSGSTTGDTPLSQFKNKTSKISSSDDSAQGTPLIRNTKSKKSLDYDSEHTSGDIPLNRKQENARKKLVNSDSDAADTQYTPLSKKKKLKLKSSTNELSSKHELRLKKKLKEMKVQYSTDSANENDNKNMLAKHSLGEVEEKDSVKGAKRKRKWSEISTASSGDMPLCKILRRQKLDKTSSKASDSQLSNDSSCDTPLVKKKVELRNAKTKVQSELSSGLSKHKVDKIKQSSEKAEEAHVHDTETSEDAIHVTKVKRSEHNTEICETNTDNDTTLEVMKGRHTRSMTFESSSDEESSIRNPDRDEKSGPKNVSVSSDINGMEYSSDESSPDVIDISDVDSDDSDDVPLAEISKKTIKTKISDLSSDSEDDIPLSKTKAAQSKQTKPITKDEEEVGPTSEMAYIRLLRQICRECQMFVRNDRELAGCSTDKEKIEKLEDMLRNVGMKGKPTMKKAEEVKLIKEAKELSADNIISSETGRVMRKVKSIWARRTISPVKPPTGGTKNLFGALKGVVDSEGSEST